MRPSSVSAFEFLRLKWLQAGFLSSAYRLAHLRSSRQATVGALALVFFLA